MGQAGWVFSDHLIIGRKLRPDVCQGTWIHPSSSSAAGMVFALWGSDLAMGATVLVGLLVVVAATVNDGVLLFTLADELRAGALSLNAGNAVQRPCLYVMATRHNRKVATAG